MKLPCAMAQIIYPKCLGYLIGKVRVVFHTISIISNVDALFLCASVTCHYLFYYYSTSSLQTTLIFMSDSQLDCA